MSTEQHATGTEAEWRLAVHRALGDEGRLAIVDALRLTDLAPSELSEQTGIASNLLAHHLDVLEEVCLVQRRDSEGDGRRRYVTLQVDDPLAPPPVLNVKGRVVFACTRTGARSRIAAALWRAMTGEAAICAGSAPDPTIEPEAAEVAAAHGITLPSDPPLRYDDVDESVGLVVAVCDVAHESGTPFDAPALHWSVPNPAGHTRADYKAVFDELWQRVDRLASA